jgi:tetratricopeptide (TPR) repeat protein
VVQLVLSPISAEFFLLRAQNDADTRYERRLADVNFALRLGPESAAAFACKARILAAAGLYQRALEACEAAVRVDAQHVEARMVRASVYARRDEYSQALEETESLLAEKDLPPLSRAQATAQRGDLHASGPARDYEAAMEHHMKAVELAAPLASSKNRQVRREARHLLVEVHLAIANDITRGNWTQKEEAAPKWLRTARSLADKMIDEDSGDEALRLLLLRKALSCYVGMKGAIDPTEVLQEALLTGSKLTAAAKDVYRRREIQWLLVESLADAVRIEQMRGNSRHAAQHAQRAIELLDSLAATEETPRRCDELLGSLYFLVGSTFAIRVDDHPQAVRWYEQALPYLSRTRPADNSPELGRQGQRLVSMGVSYWQTGARDEAVRLTEDGLEMMLVAAGARMLESSALAVPYGNLAAMYEVVGRAAEARQLAAKAASLEGQAGTDR